MTCFVTFETNSVSHFKKIMCLSSGFVLFAVNVMTKLNCYLKFILAFFVDNLITKNCKPDVIEEEAELEEYERHIKMLKKTNKQDFNSFEEKNGPEKKVGLEMF